MPKQNCWEFKQCGRCAGGAKVAELGVCRAVTETRTHRLNDGVNGGRACWAIAGTLCGGQVQGTFAAKLANCSKCEFYNLVATEEGAQLCRSREILAKLT